jgi:hypothetical protein
MILPWGYGNLLDTVSGQAYLPIIVWSRRFTTRRSTLTKRLSNTHGQYHLWQRQPGKDDRARDAARHQDQSRRLWPREGWPSRLADRLAHWPAAQSGSGSERCSKDSQNSGLFSHSAPRRGRAKPSFIPMTTCRVFAARRQWASAGLPPRRWPVIGSTARAGSNVTGRSRWTLRRSTISMSLSMSIARRAAFPDGRRSDRPTWRRSDEQGITLTSERCPHVSSFSEKASGHSRVCFGSGRATVLYRRPCRNLSRAALKAKGLFTVRAALLGCWPPLDK